MVIGPADRRALRRERAQEEFGADADAVLDILELTAMACRDCCGDITLPDHVVDDIFLVGRGSVPGLARASRLAVVDFRDLRLAAAAKSRLTRSLASVLMPQPAGQFGGGVSGLPRMRTATGR